LLHPLYGLILLQLLQDISQLLRGLFRVAKFGLHGLACVLKHRDYEKANFKGV
jgi:hypothetical protein